MPLLPRRVTRAFILRIWSEYLDQTPPSWRGEIENVTTKEVTHFSTREELQVCVRRCFQVLGEPACVADQPVGTEDSETVGCEPDG